MKIKITQDDGTSEIYTVIDTLNSGSRGKEYLLRNNQGQACRVCKAIEPRTKVYISGQHLEALED